MAGGQERVLRRRIRSIQSTKKITRAMQLIAASRIVKAQQAIAAARPYVEKMAEVVSHLADTPDGRDHPLFREPENVGPDDVRRVAVIAIAGDRGLSGAYNSSVIRATERVLAECAEAGAEPSVVASGRKVINYFRYRGRDPAASFTGFSERPTAADAKQIVDAVMEPFTNGELDEITLVYTNFISVGTQRVVVRKLIPLDPEAPRSAASADAGGNSQSPQSAGSSEHAGAEESKADYEFEPEAGEILDRLLPSWLQAEILAALLSASASEYAARQRAMKAATDNADELIKTLSRIMNRARQDAITTEIMEIVGGAEALRAGGDGDSSATETYESAGARPA
ncbi:MAG: F0F1 ATP synthase subunit gamma [Actinomycetota bacterium]|nr:F0F1 ATP synthase subunit gamma [Actinomycetota bacterium]